MSEFKITKSKFTKYYDNRGFFSEIFNIKRHKNFSTTNIEQINFTNSKKM